MDWIPVDKRLPTKEEQDDELGVLVTLGNGYSGLQFDYYYNGLWDDWNGYVIAWMPLPKPWKGVAMNSKTYKLPNGKKAVFEYDITGVGKITLECMDELMDMIADRPQGEWIEHKERTIVMDNNFVDFFPTEYECSNCGLRRATYFINSPLSNYCPNCGARMKGADGE